MKAMSDETPVERFRAFNADRMGRTDEYLGEVVKASDYDKLVADLARAKETTD